DSDARAALFTSDFQRTLQQQLRNRALDGWQATPLLNDLNYLYRIRRYLLRGHAGLGQGVPVDEQQRLEQGVNLACAPASHWPGPRSGDRWRRSARPGACPSVPPAYRRNPDLPV